MEDFSRSWAVRCPVVPSLRRAFTLIELLVVIAIIAILAAILFPVFSQAKEAAKKTRALAQMKQLATSVFIYSGDHDDFLPMASARDGLGGTPTIWTQQIQSYVKNKEIFVAPGSDGTYAEDWATRKNQNIGYTDATGVDPSSTAIPGAAPAGTEGFPSAVSFAAADESARVGLFATTPNGRNDGPGKERGYVFNPYNGPDDASVTDPAARYRTGLPLIGDTNLCTQRDYLGSDFTGRGAGALKPIFARYSADGRGNGSTPVIFADSHAKSYTAKALNVFGAVIWRFR